MDIYSYYKFCRVLSAKRHGNTTKRQLSYYRNRLCPKPARSRLVYLSDDW